MKQDYTEAMKWLRRAGEKGNAEAANAIGKMYSKGEGVKKDNTNAFNWYSKAVNGGDLNAYFKLAMMYGNGRGVKKMSVQWWHC